MSEESRERLQRRLLMGELVAIALTALALGFVLGVAVAMVVVG